jgi:hypothetical protein
MVAGALLFAGSGIAFGAGPVGCTATAVNVFDRALDQSGGALARFGGAPYQRGGSVPQARDLDALVVATSGAGTPAERFDAFLQASASNGMSVVALEYDVKVIDGRMSIGGADYTAQEISEFLQQTSVEGAAKGVGSGGEATLAKLDFFNLPALAKAGVSPGNFANRIGSLEELRRLWNVDYARTLQKDPYFVSETDAKAALEEALPQLEKVWRLRRAMIFINRFERALEQQMQRGQHSGRIGMSCGKDPAEPPQVTTTQPGSPPANVQWAGTYVNAEGGSTLTITGGGGSLGATEVWNHNGRNGTNAWKNCVVSVNSVKCDWTGTYEGDPEKTGTRHGTLTATVTGNDLTGSYFEEAPSFRGPDGSPFLGYTAMGVGAVWPMNYKRK